MSVVFNFFENLKNIRENSLTISFLVLLILVILSITLSSLDKHAEFIPWILTFFSFIFTGVNISKNEIFPSDIEVQWSGKLYLIPSTELFEPQNEGGIILPRRHIKYILVPQIEVINKGYGNTFIKQIYLKVTDGQKRKLYLPVTNEGAVFDEPTQPDDNNQNMQIFKWENIGSFAGLLEGKKGKILNNLVFNLTPVKGSETLGGLSPEAALDEFFNPGEWIFEFIIQHSWGPFEEKYNHTVSLSNLENIDNGIIEEIKQLPKLPEAIERQLFELN